MCVGEQVSPSLKYLVLSVLGERLLVGKNLDGAIWKARFFLGRPNVSNNSGHKLVHRSDLSTCLSLPC